MSGRYSTCAGCGRRYHKTRSRLRGLCTACAGVHGRSRPCTAPATPTDEHAPLQDEHRQRRSEGRQTRKEAWENALARLRLVGMSTYSVRVAEGDPDETADYIHRTRPDLA